jgi:hypothetical protein
MESECSLTFSRCASCCVSLWCTKIVFNSLTGTSSSYLSINVFTHAASIGMLTLFLDDFMLGLLLDLEHGGNVFLRNVEYSPQYMALHPRRAYPSNIHEFPS